MWPRTWILAILTALLGAGLAAAGSAPIPQELKSANDDKPLTPAEMKTLVALAIADQHANDRALNEYERTEHTVSTESGKASDTVDCVFPTGTDDVRVVLIRNSKPAEAMAIAQQWREIAKTLALRSNPNDSAVREELQKSEKRQRGHAEMVDAILGAFRFRWEGRVTIDGRPTIKLSFEPDPAYRSSARFAPVFAHTVGNAWFDESTGQVERLEAKLREDVPFYGGLLAKIYRDSWVTIVQAPVAPGVWFPLKATYDIEGRKFLFAASWRGQIDASNYRRVGTPAEALAMIRLEHADVISSDR